MSPSTVVLVLGGANVDVKARSAAAPVPGTSNPGNTRHAPGGVGRNVAENLARLGTATTLVAAVGTDPLGDWLLARTAAAGVDVGSVVRSSAPTGTYTAVLDPAGELVVAVSDMSATDALSAGDVHAVAALVGAAELLVVDGNLPVATVAAALEVAATAGVRVALEPVSVPKAARLAPLLAEAGGPFLVTPNRAELGALTGLPVATMGDVGHAVDRLHELGTTSVWVRLGAAGSLLSDEATGSTLLPVVPGPVADVTGAGDAMLAAYCHGLLAGHTAVESALLGHAAAALTVADPHTVRPDLTLDLVEQVLRHGSTP